MFSDIRIIDEIGVNERTIVSWYDREAKAFQFGIFHISDQPNIQSKISAYTTWGYLVYIGHPIQDPSEAAQVYDLFLTDLIKGDNWFEDDSNFIITDEIKQIAKDLGIEIEEKPATTTRPKLKLIKTEDL